MRGSRGIPARVARLERVRRQRGGGGGGGGCRQCGGGGYPGLFVSEGEGGEPEQVGDARCPGCGLVRVGAVVVLPAGGEHEWGGGGVEGASP